MGFIREFLAWLFKEVEPREGRVRGYMVHPDLPVVNPLDLTPPCGDTDIAYGPAKRDGGMEERKTNVT